MKTYDITIIYACHDPGTMKKGYKFPAQTLPKEQIEVIRVLEDDVFHPRKRSMEMISRAQGRYLMMLDEQDDFSKSFLEQMIGSCDKTDAAFGMPSYVGQMEKQSEIIFSLKDIADNRIIINTELSQAIFTAELHGLLLRTEDLKNVCEPCME